MITRTKTLLLPLAIALVLAGAAFQAGSQANGNLPEPIVATITVAEVINGLDEINDRQAQLEAFIRDRDQKIRDLEQRFESVRSEFDLLPSGPEKRSKAEDLERLRAQIQVESELAKVLVDRRRGEIFAELFRKISRSVSELSRQRGYTLVLASDAESGIPANPTEQQARAAIYGQRVMFAASAIDITDELVSKMNNDYRSGRP